MCGWCTEGRAVELAKALTLGKPWPLEAENTNILDALYAQESSDTLSVIQRMDSTLNKSIVQVKAKGFDILRWQELVDLRVVFCRIIDTLVNNGFNSDKYTQLIEMPLVSDVIEIVCQLPIIFDERLFRPSSLLRELFQTEFFLTSHQRLSNEKFREDCIALLQAYVSWWCDAEGMDELEWGLFLTIYPYILLSYVVVEKFYPTHKLINHLVKKDPYFGLTPDNFDGWLQRRAALRLFDTSGLSAFLPYNDKVRPQLLYYLVVKNKLDSEQKETLREAVLQSGEYNQPDSKDWASIKKRLLIWDETATWIIEALDE